VNNQPDLRVLDNVPGYRRTLARAYEVEDSYRERSYLGLSEKICGIPIGPLTLQAFLQFSRIGSPFICGWRRPAINDVAYFLFRLSPAFERARAAKQKELNLESRKPGKIESWLRSRFPNSFLASWLPDNSTPEERAAAAFIKVRREFAEQVRGIDYFAAVRAIDRFVDRMLLDKPIGSKGSLSDPADTSVPTDIIHLIAGAYGWSRDEILELPMPEVFQALRKIQRDMPGCPKRARAKVHPYATRLTRKHRRISEAAAVAAASPVAAAVSAASSASLTEAGDTPASTGTCN
jgi:hypothetical protein